MAVASRVLLIIGVGPAGCISLRVNKKDLEMTTTTAAATPVPNTRLSLYKLMLRTTVWVALTNTEYRRILAWLEQHGSNTSRPNEVDKLLQTFLWFPTREGENVYVPLGHMTRLFVQVEDRIPASATGSHANVQFRNGLVRARGELTGDRIMMIRTEMATAGASQ
jgi:hypothetical protein